MRIHLRARAIVPAYNLSSVRRLAGVIQSIYRFVFECSLWSMQCRWRWWWYFIPTQYHDNFTTQYGAYIIQPPTVSVYFRWYSAHKHAVKYYRLSFRCCSRCCYYYDYYCCSVVYYMQFNRRLRSKGAPDTTVWVNSVSYIIIYIYKFAFDGWARPMAT